MRSLLSPGRLVSLFLTALLAALAPGCDDDPKNTCTGTDCPCAGGGVSYPEFGCLVDGFTDNDRAYDWYLTQMGTGPAEGSNCGPTSTAMALRWHDEAQTVPVATIRETITPGDTGWWYTNHIEAALTTWNTPFRILHAPDETAVLDALDRGSVLLLCLTMGLITRADDPGDTHFDRFYDYDSGHFLIVKGHIGDGEWLIVHDPNNWFGDYYDDARLEPMGRDRYYRTSEVLASMGAWWPYFFEIGISDGKSTRHIPVGRSGP
jgi:hypothetical protein